MNWTIFAAVLFGTPAVMLALGTLVWAFASAASYADRRFGSIAGVAVAAVPALVLLASVVGATV